MDQDRYDIREQTSEDLQLVSPSVEEPTALLESAESANQQSLSGVGQSNIYQQAIRIASSLPPIELNARAAVVGLTSCCVLSFLIGQMWFITRPMGLIPFSEILRLSYYHGLGQAECGITGGLLSLATIIVLRRLYPSWRAKAWSAALVASFVLTIAIWIAPIKFFENHPGSPTWFLIAVIQDWMSSYGIKGFIGGLITLVAPIVLLRRRADNQVSALIAGNGQALNYSHEGKTQELK